MLEKRCDHWNDATIEMFNVEFRKILRKLLRQWEHRKCERKKLLNNFVYWCYCNELITSAGRERELLDAPGTAGSLLSSRPLCFDERTDGPPPVLPVKPPLSLMNAFPNARLKAISVFWSDFWIPLNKTPSLFYFLRMKIIIIETIDTQNDTNIKIIYESSRQKII